MLKSTLTKRGDGGFVSGKVHSVRLKWISHSFENHWPLSNCECEQWQTWAAVSYLHLLCILSFPHWHKSDRWPSTLSSSWPLQQCRQGQHHHGHCSPSEGSAVNLWFFSLWQWHLSVWSPGLVQSDWAVYGSAVLWCLWTHQGPGFEWCVRERNRNRETRRGAERFKVHFSFAVPPGEENERANNNRS